MTSLTAMRLGSSALCLALVLAASDRASAQFEVEGEASVNGSDFGSGQGSDPKDVVYERGDRTGITLGLKLGAGFSQPFGDLGTSFLTELEAGYTLPFARRALAVFVSGAYTQPGAEGSNLRDSRLPGPASYELTQQELMLTLGLTYRLHLPSKLVRPYASLGPRLFMMRTNVNGKAGGEPFGDNEETATEFGVFGALGAELFLGPGAALIELSMTWASIDGYILRETSAGALTLAVGYRLFL
jgi:Outer membrane protein beta-barrel domain